MPVGLFGLKKARECFCFVVTCNIVLRAGPFGCIGRPLALLNLRTTIARLVTTFDFDFAPGEDGHNFIERAVDHITLGMGELKLSFKKRCSGKVASHERGIGNEDHD